MPVDNYLPFFNGWDVKDIGDELLVRFSAEIRKKKLSIKMRKNILGGYSAFHSWMKGEGIPIKKDLVIPKIKGDDAKVRVAIELEDQFEVLDRIPEEHRDVYEFAFETGLRPGELATVKIKDLDMRKWLALIQRTYSACELKETTKESLKMNIPLSDRAYEIAEKHIQGRFPDEFLFINPVTGWGYKTNTLWRYWRKYVGWDMAALYDSSRHSFCTQIAEDKDANITELQSLMRHKDIRSTQKYIHANVIKFRDIVNRRGKKPVPIRGERKSEEG